MRDQGLRHDLIDAVFALGGQDDLLMIVKRVEALSKFLDSDDGKNLLAGVKRATNILKIEEKKDGRSFDGNVNTNILIQGEERELNTAINGASARARQAVAAEDFEGAMRAIAKLRAPVDAFFDKVTVNADDPSFRENRLKLLNRIRAATRKLPTSRGSRDSATPPSLSLVMAALEAAIQPIHRKAVLWKDWMAGTKCFGRILCHRKAGLMEGLDGRVKARP